MIRRRLGSQGFEVSAQGLGCMGMTYAYGKGDEQSGLETIHRALELGITFLDTAEVYGPYTNEELVGRAIAGRRDEFEIATKFGFAIDPDRPSDRATDGRPENVRRACEGSLERLGTDHIDLYYQHRVDPDVPIEETVGAMAELVERGQGAISRAVGGRAGDDPARARDAPDHRACRASTRCGPRRRGRCARHAARARHRLVAYSPLGRGFLTGQIRSLADLPEDDWRRTNPRFQEHALRENLELADRVTEIAERRGITPAQLAIAWVMAKGEDIVPIPGTKSPRRLEENAAAAEIKLSAQDVEELDNAISPEAVRGDRYAEGMMALLNN